MKPAGQQVTDTGTAGVIARPPLLFLAALLLGFVSDRMLALPFPVPRIDLVQWIIAGSLILIGLALAAAGICDFSRPATPVPTNKPTRVLVTTGIHGWTRNPIYLGMFLVYGGISVAARSPWILILTLPLAITIRYGVVAQREGVPGTAVQRRLSGLQGRRPSLAVAAVGQERWPCSVGPTHSRPV